MYLGTFLPALLISFIPLSTTTLEDHPLWSTCQLINGKDEAKHLFLLTFFIIFGNSLLVDIICYARILNFMRKNGVRVSVVASSHTERIKAHNIITAPSSLLIWLVQSVVTLPSCLLMIKSGASIDAQHIVTLVNFQQGTLFVIHLIVPFLYIASSAELRKDVNLLKKYLFGCQDEASREVRREVYTLSNTPELMLNSNIIG